MAMSLYTLVIFCFINYLEEIHSHYAGEYTQNRMRYLMYAMDRELVKDAIQKVRSIQYMKELYSKMPSYHQADRIFYIRRKFAKMMRLYTKAYEKLEKIAPTTWDLEFFVNILVEIQYLAMDIDHLVEILTEWEKGPAKKVISIAGFMIPADMSDFGIGGFTGIGGFPGPGGLPGLGGVPGHGGLPRPGGKPGAGGKPRLRGAPGPSAKF